MSVVISDRVAEHMAKKHSVSPEEVKQCFANKNGKYLRDPRAKHATSPPTQWFISETNYGRKLKVAFVPDAGDYYIRTAFPPNAEELRIYAKYG